MVKVDKKGEQAKRLTGLKEKGLKGEKRNANRAKICHLFKRNTYIFHRNALIHNLLQTETLISEMAVSILEICAGAKHCADINY
jgi:queuine/archaeosine tRNA-ribosyltransferase